MSADDDDDDEWSPKTYLREEGQDKVDGSEANHHDPELHGDGLQVELRQDVMMQRRASGRTHVLPQTDH